MGNSASQLPYSIDNQVGAPHDHNGWALHHGKSTDSNETEVSVFVGKKPQLIKQAVSPRFPNKTQLVPALHHYNQCRKLRHPHILKVLATLDTDNPTAASTDGAAASASSAESSSKTTTGDLIIVTEPCISLTEWLLKSPTPEQLAWGLECVIQGLHFLHNSAKLAHGNLSPSSLYVTESGDVKLWNFSLLTQVGPNLGPDNHFREWDQAVTPESFRSPERVSGQYDAISQAGIHAMDSFALGILIDHWYNSNIPGALQKAVQRLQTPNLKMRPRLQPLLKCPVFDTPYQKLQNQLQEIQIQPVEQKIVLWNNVGTGLQNGQIPKDLALHKVLPLVQSCIKTTCNNDNMLNQDLYRREVLATLQPLFFIVENYMEEDKISKLLGPLVSLLFKVKDRGVRGALLSKVTFMCQHLDKSTLNASVFEPLCSGFNDSSPALRELTLKATLGLVPYLNAPNMEKLSRYLVRLQGDTETSIRTNAVIFIAKIAPSLTEIAREKILLNAYARAMKDGFAPCRLSALQSTLNTKDLFSKSDMACKVLPVVTPLLLDPMTNVRQQAFEVVQDLMKSLQEESKRMETLAQQQAAQQQEQQAVQQQTQQAQPGTAPAATETPAPQGITPAPASGSYLSGLSSWMSSSAKPDTAAAAAPPAPSPAPPVPAQPVQSVAAAPVPVQQFAATNLAAPAPAAPVVDDGWGDDDADGWGDDDDDDDGPDPFSHIGAKTTGSVPAPAAFAPPASSQLGMDDDPFAAIGMKPATAIGNRRSGGKLVMPKKSGAVIKPKAAAPATKLKLDASEMADGWDDF